MEFKLRLLEEFLAGTGSVKAIAVAAGINHSLLLYWIDKYQRGEFTLEKKRREELREASQRIAALERKIGQLTMEIDYLRAVVPSSRALGDGARAAFAESAQPT
ncbi:MAG: transposase [Gemmatimonadaceae bacterium]